MLAFGSESVCLTRPGCWIWCLGFVSTEGHVPVNGLGKPRDALTCIFQQQKHRGMWRICGFGIFPTLWRVLPCKELELHNRNASTKTCCLNDILFFLYNKHTSLKTLLFKHTKENGKTNVCREVNVFSILVPGLFSCVFSTAEWREITSSCCSAAGCCWQHTLAEACARVDELDVCELGHKLRQVTDKLLQTSHIYNTSSPGIEGK